MREKVTSEDGENPNAISLFGQAANANDFPVLKAFQEYIDAEQAKARKRMLGLSIFFVVLLVAVVITFTVIVISIFSHNRELSDRLLDVAFRERERQLQPVAAPAAPPPIVQPVVTPVVAPSQDSGMKPILEKLDALAAALVARQQQAVQPPAPVVVTTAPATVTPSASAESVEAREMREMIKKQQAELEAERNRLKEAEEKLRKAEIERHRRRLYPEYYAQQDAAEARERVSSVPTPKPVPRPVAVTPEKVVPQAKPSATPLKDLKPINYFAQGEDDELVELIKKKQPHQAQPAPTVPSAQPKDAPTPKPSPAHSSQPAKVVSAAPTAKESPSVQTAPPPKVTSAVPTTKAAPSVPVTPPIKTASVAPLGKAAPAVLPVQSAKKESALPIKKETAPSVKTEPIPSTTAAQSPAKRPEPVKKQPAPPPSIKTETLDVGTSSDNSIPWLIEERDL